MFNTFQFPKGDEKKLDKVLEQFERYSNPSKKVVFERYQFWQITPKDSESVDQFVTRLKNKIKSFDYASVGDVVRDKCVFNIPDRSGCEGKTIERRKAYIRESDLCGESV